MVEMVWNINGLCINLWLERTVNVLWPRLLFLVPPGRQYRLLPDTVLENSKVYATTHNMDENLHAGFELEMAGTTTQCNENMAANAASQHSWTRII